MTFSLSDLECECFGEKVLFEDVPTFEKKIERLRDGHVTRLTFEDVGVISVSCIRNNNYPLMDTLLHEVKERRVKENTLILKGEMNFDGFVWREDIITKNISVQYVVKKEFMSEFDGYLNSIKLID